MTLPHPFRAASCAPELGLISCPHLTFPQHSAPSLQVSAEMVPVNALAAIKSASNEKSSIWFGNYVYPVQLYWLWIEDPVERKTTTVKLTTWPLLLWQDDL